MHRNRDRERERRHPSRDRHERDRDRSHRPKDRERERDRERYDRKRSPFDEVNFYPSDLYLEIIKTAIHFFKDKDQKRSDSRRYHRDPKRFKKIDSRSSKEVIDLAR